MTTVKKKVDILTFFSMSDYVQTTFLPIIYICWSQLPNKYDYRIRNFCISSSATMLNHSTKNELQGSNTSF